MKEEFFIKACSGRAIDVKKGQWITVTDLEGGQVVDFLRNALLIRENFYPQASRSTSMSL